MPIIKGDRIETNRKDEDESSSANESDSLSFEDYNFATNSANEDIFITDITSGFVTVTIKESLNPAGFFKARSST